jgi:hypothetical protein
MPILIEDPALERRLLALGDSQALPAPHKATVARFLLAAACDAYETGDATRLWRLLQLGQPVVTVQSPRVPDTEAWRSELQRKEPDE